LKIHPKDAVTIAIPIYNLCEYRTNNLNFILSKLIHSQYRIVVFEHVNDDSKKYQLKYPDRVQHIKLFHPGDTIHKSWLINMIPRFVTGTYVWVIDSDFYMDFTSFILTHQLLTKYKFIQPYYYARDLSKSETETLHSNGSIEVDYYKNNERHVNVYGALSFIFNIEYYVKIGGMDESYKGWGYEDYDLFLKIHEQYPDAPVYINKRTKGVHQYHEKPPSINKQGDLNRKIFEAKNYSMQQVNALLKKHYYKDWTFDNLD